MRTEVEIKGGRSSHGCSCGPSANSCTFDAGNSAPPQRNQWASSPQRRLMLIIKAPPWALKCYDPLFSRGTCGITPPSGPLPPYLSKYGWSVRGYKWEATTSCSSVDHIHNITFTYVSCNFSLIWNGLSAHCWINSIPETSTSIFLCNNIRTLFGTLNIMYKVRFEVLTVVTVKIAFFPGCQTVNLIVE
jgi:hypothetical protein